MQVELVKQFIKKFQEGYREGTEIKLLSSQVRGFLREQKINLSFQKFNSLLGCRGRSTGAYYIYDLIKLYSLIDEAKYETERLQCFPYNRINTISYWGSKKRWCKEWNILLRYAYSIGCNSVLDCFGGSGYLSLAASKLGLFNNIFLNDFSRDCFNYHLAIKDDILFDDFIKELGSIGHLVKKSFDLLKQEYYNLDGTVVYNYRGGKKILQTASAVKAAQYYALKHYSFDTQGAYTGRRKKVSSSIESLKHTQMLYRQISISNYYYKKLLLKYMEQQDWLILLDPVYLKTLRSQTISYEIEFTELQHKHMLKVLCQGTLKAKVILCGYRAEVDDLYSNMLSTSKQTWHCLRLRRGGKQGDMTDGKEHIWTNFDVTKLIQKHGEYFEYIE